MIFLKSINCLPFWIGFFYCAFFILFPFLYSFFKTPSGFVWVPINNQHRLSGDARIYASCVQEARLNFFKFKHPCAPDIGNMAIDFTRITSYRTAALLGFFIPDERLAIILSFLLSVLIQYSLIFSIILLGYPYPVMALLYSIIMVFYLKIFIHLNTKNGLRKALTYFKDSILNRHRESFFEIVNDNFRYVVMSVSGIFVWATILIASNSFTTLNLPIILIIFFLYFIIIPFVYPPVSIISLCVMVGSILINCFFINQYNLLLLVLISGTAAVVVLTVSGLYVRISDIRKSNLDVLKGSHDQNENYNFSLSTIYNLLIKDLFFTTSLLFFILIIPFVKQTNAFVPVILFTFIMIKLLGFLFKKNIIVFRFIERGGVHYLFFAIIYSISIIASAFLSYSATLHFLGVAVVILTISFSAIGCLRMARTLFKTGAHFMPEEEWEMYRFIKLNTKARSLVLAFSFSNLQMLPVYTHANLFVRGAEWLENPDEELKKYIGALKMIGNDCEFFLKGFTDYFSLKFFGVNFANDSEIKLKNFHLINTLIYYPYAKKIGNILLEKTGGGGWSDQFRDYLHTLVSSTDKLKNTDSIDYLLIDKEEISFTTPISGLITEVFSNKKYILFANRH